MHLSRDDILNMLCHYFSSNRGDAQNKAFPHVDRVVLANRPFVRIFNYLKMAKIRVVFHSFVLCLFSVSTAQVDVVTVPASPSIVML
jgi:hypothetical protein